MDQRHSIIHMYEKEGLSEREIARRLLLSPSTVHYWIQRGGEKSKTKKGRPRATQPTQDVKLYEAIQKDPFKTAVDLQKELVPHCSVDTVRNRLKQHGLKCRIPARKPFLTPYHRDQRSNFAKAHAHWDLEAWKKVVFSDEKIFRSSSRGALRVYRPKNASDRYDDRYLVNSSNPILNGTPRFTICVWMAIGGSIRQLHRIEQKTLNSEYYTTKILPIIENQIIQENLIFMQDLSSIHTSKATKEWLRQHNIPVMDDWPPKGPDMNPVENVWAELVRRVEKLKRGIQNRDQLWEDILRAFQEIPDSYFENLIKSMPKRVATVAAKRGGWTKY